MVWYTGDDLTTYNQGDKFVPLERFTLPYERSAPVEEEEKVITSYPGQIQQKFSDLTGIQRRPVSEMGTVQYNPKFTRSYSDGMTSFGLDQPINPDGTFAGQGAFGEMPVVPQLDERLTSKIPLGIGSMISMALPDKYYSDFTVPEQALTQM